MKIVFHFDRTVGSFKESYLELNLRSIKPNDENSFRFIIESSDTVVISTKVSRIHFNMEN